MTLMAGAFVPERQIPSEQRDRLSPGEREGGKCTEGAVTASLSRMTQMSWPEPPNLREPLNVPACPHQGPFKLPASHIFVLVELERVWAGRGTEAAQPHVSPRLASSHRTVTANWRRAGPDISSQSRETTKRGQGYPRPHSGREKPSWTAKPMLLATTQT